MTSTPPSPMLSQPSPSTQAPPKKPSPPPTSILPTRSAKIYAAVHPALLLILLAIRFQPLVSNPVTELLNDLPILAVLQVAYVVVCLPAAGGGSSTGSTVGSGTSRGAAAGGGGVGVGYRRKHGHHGGQGGGISTKVIPALLSLTLTLLLATPTLTILLILFGAPLTTHTAESVLCGAHMAVLSATGLIYVHGVDGAVWREIWGVARPADGVWGGALGTGIGAWMGAVPVPLDWDRPWQAYPITILTGAYIGFVVGSVVGRSRGLFGKRVEFSSEELGVDKKAD